MLVSVSSGWSSVAVGYARAGLAMVGVLGYAQDGLPAGAGVAGIERVVRLAARLLGAFVDGTCGGTIVEAGDREVRPEPSIALAGEVVWVRAPTGAVAEVDGVTPFPLTARGF